MKYLPFTAILTSTILFISCLSEKEVNPGCINNDLTLQLDTAINPTCTVAGSIKLIATGGSGSLSFKIDGSGSQSSSLFEGVSAGTYSMSVHDKNGCSASLAVSLDIPDGGMVTSIVSSSSAGCGTSQGAVEVSVTGGAGGYKFKLNEDGAQQGSGAFENLAAGKYRIFVTDSESCVTSIDHLVTSGISLKDDIMPIINANCAVSGCHKDSQTPLFTSEANVLANASRIKSQTGSGSMPPSTEPDLTAAQIAQIACWADDVAAAK